ncbi:MAG: hypothetical protein WD049_02520 [Candidatus Paceibacterota bacterium]
MRILCCPHLPGSPELSPFFNVLASRVLHRHAALGWSGLVARVASTAHQAESSWNEPDQEDFLSRLRTALAAGTFLPNSPLLVHAGDARPKLFACFAIDACRPLDEFLALARNIHNGMGGVGFSLERFGDAASAETFLAAVDEDTVANQAGRPRPASSAVTVPISHPAAEAVFARSGRMRTINMNLGISDSFMVRLSGGDPTAATAFKRLADAVHLTGQPGVVFTDRIPRIACERDAVFAANVCGEAPLAADESGLLGSLNLVAFARRNSVGAFALDEAGLQETTATAVRFLDGMHDLHYHASSRLGANSLATRKIGVGVMGFAHLLVLLGVAYDSPEAEVVAGNIGRLMTKAAQSESERLAALRGSFPAWRPVLGISSRRNACLVAIAGTATLALLVGTTGGIEPIFAHVGRHRVMECEFAILDPLVAYMAQAKGLDPVEVAGRLVGGERLDTVLGPILGRLLPTAIELSGEAHVRIQAAFQREIDGGISKTINCPARTTPEQIGAWVRLAHECGCMGLTIYRDNSLPSQPVSRLA